MVRCSTVVNFPDSAKVNVEESVAREIRAAAERLPLYDNREFYSPELEAIQDAMAAKHRFELTEHLLRMIGVCYDCRKARLASVKKTATSRAAAR